MSRNAIIFNAVRDWMDDDGFTTQRISSLDSALVRYLAAPADNKRNAIIFETIRGWLDEQGFGGNRIVELDDALARFLAAPADGLGLAGNATAATGSAQAPSGFLDRAAEDRFFEAVRTSGLFPRGVDQSQRDGIKTILAATAKANYGLAWTANTLATAYLETNKTMQPVAEAYYLAGRVRDLDAWRRKNLRYYPHYGRGYPQVTWLRNYQKADAYLASLGLIKPGELLANLDLMLEARIAAPVMTKFMADGTFTGKGLGDYLPRQGPGDRTGHREARRVINGKDRWDDLADFAMKFQAALQTARS